MLSNKRIRVRYTTHCRIPFCKQTECTYYFLSIFILFTLFFYNILFRFSLYFSFNILSISIQLHISPIFSYIYHSPPIPSFSIPFHLGCLMIRKFEFLGLFRITLFFLAQFKDVFLSFFPNPRIEIEILKIGKPGSTINKI